MKPTLISVAVLLSIITFPAALTAQNSWLVELRGGRTVAGIIQSDLNSSGGWNLGIGVGHDLPGGVQIYAHGAYHRFSYAANVAPIVSIRPMDLSDPTVAEVGATTSGPASSMAEGSLELRVISPHSVVAPFLSIQSGVYVLNLRDIVIEGVAPQRSYFVGYQYSTISQTLVKGFASLGLGTEVSVGDHVTLGVSANYARTFDGDFVFVPIVSTVGFRF